MRMIDLSSPVDATFWEPDEVTHTPLSPAEGARHMASEMREHFGIDFSVDLLPDGEFLNNDLFSLAAHTGTHVDAPAHYGSRAAYRAAGPRTIDELPLEWFHAPAFVLDVSDAGVGAVDAAYLAKELARIGYQPAEHDIALLRTGAAGRLGTPAYFTDFVGLDASAVHFLLDFGIRVIGTDAFSLDAPFTDILRRFQETGDRGVLWPAHFAGREREYCQIERLANLDALPRPYGFTLSCFPVKLARAGAGWARAVALLPE
ncbi:cyclase family protein [Micromonospora auratinigra]|uniref:Kynurenine formamidase n=1 Tax=Micromonospora auratinigra TaxID=261654 RepID=A0A1A8ZGB3_9ACTN|nr:cyclase family protein [Micromonospora auratinigra]SBT42914.1 Kynurenine formamidase [Micromonospora auratinigra]